MSNRTTLDFYCDHCGCECMVTYDQDNQTDDPIFCPFCAGSVESDLDFDDQD